MKHPVCGVLTIFLLCLAIGACATKSQPLAVLPTMGAEAASQNLQGIQAYKQERWEEARRHFEAAIAASPQVAELHYNLALTLHHLEAHEAATTHFRKAAALDLDNRTIRESPLYRSHVGEAGTFERHMQGGYRY